ncbi:MAG: ribosome recycling factor [Bacilli bacterium]
MNDILKLTESSMQKVIENLDKRLINIRAGRANASIVDGVMVNYYGVATPLKQLVNISIPEARTLSIKPFDRSALGAIEKGIYEASIGLTPNNNGEVIILNIPALTEDTRKEYVKQAKNVAEEARIALRTIRQDANNDAKKIELQEDDVKYCTDKIQELINKYNKLIDDKLKEKEHELLSV